MYVELQFVLLCDRIANFRILSNAKRKWKRKLLVAIDFVHVGAIELLNRYRSLCGSSDIEM